MRHLLLAAVLLGSTIEPAQTVPPLLIRVNVQPSVADSYQLLRRPTPDTYSCNVTVFDAQSKKAVAGIGKVIVAPGKSETAKSSSLAGYDVEFTVKIEPAKNLRLPTGRAEIHVIVRAKDAVVAEQQSTIALLHTKPGNQPLE